MGAGHRALVTLIWHPVGDTTPAQVRHMSPRAHCTAAYLCHACLRHACLRHACLRHACLRDACHAIIV